MARLRDLLLAGLLTSAFCVPAAQAGLRPHRAIYQLGLAQQGMAGPLQTVAGSLAIEWQRTCDGWISNQWLWFIGSTHENGDLQRDVRFSSFEAGDGSHLQYSVRSYDGEAVEEAFRGEAWIKPQRGGLAHFKEPDQQDVRLPPGAIFPAEHLKRVIAGALAGERVMSHQVFDGWGYDALTQVTTVIGRSRPIEPLAARPGDDGETRAWPVSMAYFDLKDQGSLPEFEAAFLLSQDGVLRDLTLDYGDFGLDGELERLNFLDPPKC